VQCSPIAIEQSHRDDERGPGGNPVWHFLIPLIRVPGASSAAHPTVIDTYTSRLTSHHPVYPQLGRLGATHTFLPKVYRPHPSLCSHSDHGPPCHLCKRWSVRHSFG